MNDCKYGYDVKLDELCLILLRGLIWFDLKVDVGIYEFIYVIYFYIGSWENVGIV